MRHDAFRKQESGREFFVVARRPHRDHERAPIHPDLERGLNRHRVSHDGAVWLADRDATQAHVGGMGGRTGNHTAILAARGDPARCTETGDSPERLTRVGPTV